MEEACSLIAIQIDPSPKSSVFPLVGGDLPTITIVAMALRLAGRLEAALGIKNVGTRSIGQLVPRVKT